MALWKEPAPAAKSNAAPASFDESAATQRNDAANDRAPAPVAVASPAPARAPEAKESLISADLAIEGKIEGAGHVRIAGKFKGDVNVRGNLTIEPGAKVTGSVRAEKVVIGGELEGNVESAKQVELLSGGVLAGDLKAGSLTVANGARMRGSVEFGWEGTSGNGGNGKGKDNA